MVLHSYKIFVEISVHLVDSFGTWLPNRDDLYLSMELFGERKRSTLMCPSFPLVLEQRFCFEKTFHNVHDLLDVSSQLKAHTINIELCQVTDVYLGGTLLACYDAPVDDFLQLVTCLGNTKSTNGQIKLTRTVDFPGDSPSLQYSAYTSVRELDNCLHCSKSSHDCGCHCVCDICEPPLRRPVARALPEPELSWPQSNNGYDENCPKCRADIRPPFIVRKVNTDLIGRKPALYDDWTVGDEAKRPPTAPCPHRSRSISPGRYRSYMVSEPLQQMRVACEVCNWKYTGKRCRCTEAPLAPKSPTVSFHRPSPPRTTLAEMGATITTIPQIVMGTMKHRYKRHVRAFDDDSYGRRLSRRRTLSTNRTSSPVHDSDMRRSGGGSWESLNHVDLAAAIPAVSCTARHSTGSGCCCCCSCGGPGNRYLRQRRSVTFA